MFFLDTFKHPKPSEDWYIAYTDGEHWKLTPISGRAIKVYGNRQERKQIDTPVTWWMADKYWRSIVRDFYDGNTYRIEKRKGE